LFTQKLMHFYSRNNFYKRGGAYSRGHKLSLHDVTDFFFWCCILCTIILWYALHHNLFIYYTIYLCLRNWYLGKCIVLHTYVLHVHVYIMEVYGERPIFISERVILLEIVLICCTHIRNKLTLTISFAFFSSQFFIKNIYVNFRCGKSEL